MNKHFNTFHWLGVAATWVCLSLGLPSIAQPKNAGQNQYGAGLGKLLTTERERIKIDNLRFNNNTPEPFKVQEKEEAPVYVEPPKPWHIEGISNRPSRPVGQRISVWIDGQVYTEDELPKGLSIVRNAQGEVIGLNSVVSKGKIEFAKIGDSITRPQTAEEAKAIELAAQKQQQKLAAKPAEKSDEKPAEKLIDKLLDKLPFKP
jgi:hypothetical protein